MSGGQKQRVALARSMVVRPAILLFDEPLSALDLSLRLQLRAEIKRLHDEIGFSAIYVTHDQGEAMAMSSRVAVMRSGRIEQIDRPKVFARRPANSSIPSSARAAACRIRRHQARAADAAGAMPLDLRLANGLADGDWRLYVRPEPAADRPRRPRQPARARLDFTEFLGDVHRYHFKAGKLSNSSSTTRAGSPTGPATSSISAGAAPTWWPTDERRLRNAAAAGGKDWRTR
jgi:ABC-type sugar transport system ATPase subunit